MIKIFKASLLNTKYHLGLQLENNFDSNILNKILKKYNYLNIVIFGIEPEQNKHLYNRDIDLKSIFLIIRLDLLNSFEKIQETIRNKIFNIDNFNNGSYIINNDKYKLTISIITIGNHQFKYALESALEQNIDYRINIIKNISPAYNAANNFIFRCKTRYNIQMDEDMIFLNKNTSSEMLEYIMNNNIWMACYFLEDKNFGIKNYNMDYTLCGIKIFDNYKIKSLQNLYIPKNNFACDREFNKIMNKSYNYTLVNKLGGYHQKNHNNFDLFLRTAKIGKEIQIFKNNIYINSYELGIFMRCIQSFEITDFYKTVSNILNNLKIPIKKYNYFFKDFKFSENNNFYKDYYLNKSINFYNYLFIKEENNNNIIKKNNNYYLLFGILYGIFLDYDYDASKYEYFKKILF